MIPRILHRIWLNPPMPEEFRLYGDGWRNLHPGWEMRLWTETNIPVLENQNLYDEAPKIAPHSIEQFRADVLRYEILLTHGGLYVDADFECQRNFSPLLNGASLVGAWESDGVWINNALLAATPANRFLEALVHNLPASVELNRGKPPNHLSGPRFLTRMYRGLKPEMRLLPSSTVFPYSFDELWREGDDFPEAYAIHKWNNRRKRQRRA